ncbi:DUF4251 domain-containing protein [Flavihumibacter petaseus]|nr:DUF4251 domain-containing protein [Flavihumibacter petaseus]
MRNLIMAALLLYLGSACGTPKEGSSEAAAANIVALVDSQTYQFTATQMNPQGGRSRILNTLYFVRVDKDKLSVDLPYVGRAYNASIGTSDSPLRFETNTFEQSVKEAKNGGREITIKPSGQNTDVRELFLTIFSNGAGTLNVTSNNRQSISFSGNVSSLPQKK